MSKNLHPQILKNIEQSEKDGGVFLKDLKPGDKLLVQTRNTLYTIAIGEDQTTIQGHPVYCPVPTVVTINGSTWGGSMIKTGFIGIGMHLEFILPAGNYKPDRASLIITSPIRRIEFGSQSNGVREIIPMKEISE